MASQLRCSIEELDEFCINGEYENGEACEHPVADAIDGMKTTGCWGYVDDKSVIHYWADPSVEPTTLIHFLAHEIGHRTGEPCEDEHEEEMRAEAFGEVAKEAYELMLFVLDQLEVAVTN